MYIYTYTYIGTYIFTHTYMDYIQQDFVNDQVKSPVPGIDNSLLSHWSKGLPKYLKHNRLFPVDVGFSP